MAFVISGFQFVDRQIAVPRLLVAPIVTLARSGIVGPLGPLGPLGLTGANRGEQSVVNPDRIGF